MDYYDWKPYVPAGARRARALLEARRLAKKGRPLSPVTIEGRKIARTFWGTAWCDNLERYSDFVNRLPRGRTYVRNGSVVHLQVDAGAVDALVVGSEMYEVHVKVAAIPGTQWSSVCKDCSGAIDSLVELLQGRLSDRVMARICQEGTGLFPAPGEVTFSCSCPDWAYMCKHVAAVLYGIGARLDERPELLFLLRQVNQQDLIAVAGTGLTGSRRSGAPGKVLDEDDLSAIFGIEIADVPPRRPAAQTKRLAAAAAPAPPAPAARPASGAGGISSDAAKSGRVKSTASRAVVSESTKKSGRARPRQAKTPRR
jgi:uncharacterized Zn finger protein